MRETYGIQITTLVGSNSGETRWLGENTLGKPITGSRQQMEKYMQDLDATSIVMESVKYELKLYKGSY